MAATSGVRRMGAAALDLAYVAAGRFDGFWEFGLSPWDIAAGLLLVREAGGFVSDLAGGHDDDDERRCARRQRPSASAARGADPGGDAGGRVTFATQPPRPAGARRAADSGVAGRSHRLTCCLAHDGAPVAVPRSRGVGPAMQTAPVRQPRVSPAAPRAGRAWITAACLVGAVLTRRRGDAAAVRRRLSVSQPQPRYAQASAQPSAPPCIVACRGRHHASEPRARTPPIPATYRTAACETRYSDLPLERRAGQRAAARATRLQAARAARRRHADGRRPGDRYARSADGAPGATAAGRRRAGAATDPAARPAAAAAGRGRPAVSPPPARREPLPLQTDLLPATTPGRAPLAEPGSATAMAERAAAADACERRGMRDRTGSWRGWSSSW